MNQHISIITPSYNQGQFIERTIRSVLTQNIPNLEYIVVDGGSTDDTLEILKKYNLQIQWRSEPDKGQTHAINKGINNTTGDIIGWLNSDDVYYPEALQKIYIFFQSHPEIDIVYGNAHHIDVHDNIIEPYYTEDWNIERLKEICYLCQPAVFFRRSVVKRFGMLNEQLQYCMDYEYWLRLALGDAHFTYLPEFLAGSRLHDNTKTLGSRVKVHAEINDMLKNHFKKVPDRWLCNYAHVIVESKYAYKNASAKKRTIAIQSMLASLYWNKRISSSLLFTTFKWFMSSFKKQQAMENIST